MPFLACIPLGVELKTLREYVDKQIAGGGGSSRVLGRYAESCWNKLQELFYKEIPKSMKWEVAELIGILATCLSRQETPKFSRYHITRFMQI